jgi:predicted ATPase
VKLVRIEIENLKAISRMVIDAGTITVLRGSNETGKTSVLDAVRCVFEGGHDPSLIRHGAEQASVRMVLDDGTTIVRTITQTKSTAVIKNAEGGKVPREETFLKQLAAGFAFDPLLFLDAKTSADRQKRYQFCLDAMPITFTRAEIEAAAKVKVQQETYSLEDFNIYRDGRYGARTEANGRVVQLHATRKTLAEALPGGELLKMANAESPGAIPTEEELRREVKAAEAKKTAAEKTLREALGSFQKDYDALKKSIDEWEKVELEKIRQQAKARQNELMSKFQDQLAEDRKPYDLAVHEASAAVGSAQERLNQAMKLQGVRESIARLDSELSLRRAEAGVLDDIVTGLDKLKKGKLEQTPIPGLEFRNGDIYMDGTPFEQLNTQTRIFLACQIGSLKFGKLPLMVVDEIESVDEMRWAEFVAGVKEAGFQLIAARVDEQRDEQGNPIPMPLTVEVTS